MFLLSSRLVIILCGVVLFVGGCKKKDVGTASQQDTPSTPEQIKIGPDTPIVPTGKLTKDDYILLELAQSKYYHNRQITGPRPPKPDTATLLKYATQVGDSGKAVLAAQTIFIDKLVRDQSKQSNDRMQLFEQLPTAIKTSMVRIALEGFPSGYDMDLDALEASSESFTGLVSDGRRSLLRQSEGNVALYSRSALAAAAAYVTYAPMLGMTDLSTTHPIQTRAHHHDPVNYTINGQTAWLEGRFVELTYGGPKPITNVLVTTELQTTGASTEFSPTQKGISLFNRYFASRLNSKSARERYGDAATIADRIQFANNYYKSMPKASFVFVRMLKPGDVLHVPLGFASWEFVTGAIFAINSDQGYWPAREVQLYENEKAEFASCTPGATEAHARKYHPDLRVVAANEWPKPPVPDVKKFATGTRFYTSGTVKDPLPATVFGFADGKVVFAEQFEKEWVPPHIVGKQVKLGMVKQDVFDLFLDKSSRNGQELKPNQWPVSPRPNHSNLPKDTVFYEYGQAPDFFVVGFSDGKTVYAEYIRRKPRGE